eukprot:TRINITY_DN1048_c0_g2_i1.p1 TRINITY_DN1048_c0_g2~~TRINITY_DN1048_c0_g2_i1.p1  ORF type:complete len:343 (-),score=79.77 TRINITY_DN1048_c0_g2_i1:39-989(-)
MAKTFDTGHGDMLHDAQMDFYGKRLATCSSDRTVKVHDVSVDKGVADRTVAELRGHAGPVWEVAWAHPKFGNVLASCSYDGKVIVWRESSGEWRQEYDHTVHEGSVNSISWAPHEAGLMLACGSSDGRISILSSVNSAWTSWAFTAHAIGVNAVSWAPALHPSALLSEGTPDAPSKLRLVSGGSDKLVKLWTVDPASQEISSPTVLKAHDGWVRDVAWASNVGLPYESIASCDQNGMVVVWSCGPNKDGSDTSDWSSYQLPDMRSVVWRVSWSVTGNMLAVSSSDSRVTLWKQSLEHDGRWKMVSEVGEGGAQLQE